MAAPLKQAVSLFTRLSLSQCSHQTRTITTQGGPMCFQATAILQGEPMKKRKKTDAAIVQQKEAKKRRKLEKAIRKLETKGRKLKPIEEIEGDRAVIKTLHLRQRPTTQHSFEESERRALLLKEWSRFKQQQHAQEVLQLDIAASSQMKALEELRLESEDLYQAAIQVDEELFPFTMKAPLSTPPLNQYEPPDGDYIDTTRKFDK